MTWQNIKDRIANINVDTNLVNAPTSEQYQNINIIKRIQTLEAKFKYIGQQLWQDISDLEVAANDMIRIILGQTNIIKTSVDTIATVLKDTTARVASDMNALGSELYAEARDILEPAQYIKEQIKDAKRDYDDLKYEIRHWDVKDAIREARDCVKDLLDALKVAAYSDDHGGPLFFQIADAFADISKKAINLRNSFNIFAEYNNKTIKKGASNIKGSVKNIVRAINNYSAAFKRIFSNLAKNMQI